ncbi:MAG: hypothetical protein ACTS2F_15840 [Thainema sp.]
MSDISQRNASFNTAANSKVHHAQLSDIAEHVPEKLGHIKRGGIRSGPGRNEAQAQTMVEKIPPSQRAGHDGKSAATKVKEYLADKDASHVKPHSKGGSSDPSNIKWESKAHNRARGNRAMTAKEQRQLTTQARIDNITGAVGAGIKAMPKGAAIGVITTAPFSMLRNGLRVIRGEISAQDAALQTTKETILGGGVGAATAFTVTTVAAACPPIAVALAAISPALLAAGGAGMVYEFFKVLDYHKDEVQKYYRSLTQQDLNSLKEIESELLYEHSRHLEFFDDIKELNSEITNRPLASGVEGALNRYLESSAIARSLDAETVGTKQLSKFRKALPSH